MKKYILNSFLSIVFLVGISSCVKDHPAEPPVLNGDPTNITANTTIKALRTLSPKNYVNETVIITQNLIISAVVVGDDRSGNLYKQLAIQDSTGGIILLLGGTYIYTQYPVGRRLFVKLQGMILVNNYGIYSLASYIDNTNTPQGIPSDLFGRYIVPGAWGITIMPKVVSLSKLPNDSLQAELIEIDNVQVISANLTHPYYSLKYGAGITLESCAIPGKTAEIYSSKYANFANSVVPSGNGSVVALYLSDYYNIPQLTVRDTSEISLFGARPCD